MTTTNLEYLQAQMNSANKRISELQHLANDYEQLQRENEELKAAVAPHDWELQRQAIRRRTNMQNKAYGKSSQAVHSLRAEVALLRSRNGITQYVETMQEKDAEIERLQRILDYRAGVIEKLGADMYAVQQENEDLKSARV